MLDKKTNTILRSLGKLSEDSAYKVVTVEEILNTLPSKIYDTDSVKQTVDYLSKQEFIVIKFEEDYTFCYSLLPKARIYLESDTSKSRTKKQNLPLSWIFINGLVAGMICFVLNLLFYFAYLK